MLEGHVCPELRDLNVASGNTLVTWLHTSPREMDRYQAVCPILGQEPIGNNYEHPEAAISLNGGLSCGGAAGPEESVVLQKFVWASLVSFFVG